MPLLLGTATSTASQAVTSSDGALTAVTNPAHAGILLRAVLSGTQPPTVTFYRTDPDGTRQVVRSGDPAPLIEGMAFAYDHEARPGVTYSYTVTGAAESTAAVLSVPWIGRGGWLRSISEPSRSVRVLVARPLEFTRAANVALSPVLGATYPAGAVWPRAGLTRSLVVECLTPADRDALWATLDTGVLRYDEYPSLSQRSSYLLPGDASETQIGFDAGGAWTITIAMTEMARPATNGAPFLMPGWGWTEAVAGLANMTEVQTAYPNMWAMLLGGAGGVPVGLYGGGGYGDGPYGGT